MPEFPQGLQRMLSNAIAENAGRPPGSPAATLERPTTIPQGGGQLEQLQALAKTDPERVADVLKIWRDEDRRGGAGNTGGGFTPQRDPWAPKGERARWEQIRRTAEGRTPVAPADTSADALAANNQDELQRLLDQWERENQGGAVASQPAQEQGRSQLEQLQELAKTKPEEVAKTIQIWFMEDRRGERYPLGSGPATATGAGGGGVPPTGPAPRGPEPTPVPVPEPTPAREGVRILGRPWKEFVAFMLVGSAANRLAQIPLLAAGFGSLPAAVLGSATVSGIIRGAREIGRQYAEKQAAFDNTQVESGREKLRRKFRDLKSTDGNRVRTEILVGAVAGGLGVFVGYEIAGAIASGALSGVGEFLHSIPKPEFSMPGLPQVPDQQPQAPAPSAPPAASEPLTGPDWFKDINNPLGDFEKAAIGEVGKYHQQALDNATRQILTERPNLDANSIEEMRKHMLGKMEVQVNDLFNSHMDEWRKDNLSIAEVISKADPIYKDLINSENPTGLISEGLNFLSVQDQIHQAVRNYGRATTVEAGRSIASVVSQQLGVDIMKLSGDQLRTHHLDVILGAALEELQPLFKTAYPNVPMPVRLSEIPYLFDLAAGGDDRAKNRILAMFSMVPKAKVELALGIDPTGTDLTVRAFMLKIMALLAELRHK